MSRIGKKPIPLPAGVTVQIDGDSVAVKGPKGELHRDFPRQAQIAVGEGSVQVTLKEGKDSAVWGLSRALLNNMIAGVSQGFEKALEFNGVGFKAQVKGHDLELDLGYTNPVTISAPEGVAFQVEKNTIRISGIDKAAVGQTAAHVRAARPPEPYKGTGIKYKDEVIRRKAGKKAVAGA